MVPSGSPEGQPTMVPITTEELLKEKPPDEKCREIMAGINRGERRRICSDSRRPHSTKGGNREPDSDSRDNPR